MKTLMRCILLAVLMPRLALSCELEDIANLFPDQTIYLDFRQSKQVASLSRPLVSTGIIWMNPDNVETSDSNEVGSIDNPDQARQLVWQVQRPIKSTMVISATSVRQFNRQDELLPAINNQIVTDLAGVFLSLLGGEFDQLQQSFNLSVSCDNDDWVLRMEPLSETFRSLFNYIELTGNDKLQAISFQEQRGDITNISFTMATAPVPDLEAYLD